MLQPPLNVSPPAALHAIEQPIDTHLPTRVSGNQRDRKYGASEVLAALDAFAARAGRRGGR